MRDHLQEEQNRALNKLCDLALALIRSTPLSVGEDQLTIHQPDPLFPLRSQRRRQKTSPASIASMMLGVSLSLMLCGSMTFVIGFFLMPWVLGVVMVLYFVGIISNLSGLGMAILFPNLNSSSMQCESSQDDTPRGPLKSKLSYL